MTYNSIQPPFELSFREMSKQDLIRYSHWFHDTLPDRLDELARALRETSGYESWQPDGSAESLDLLGRWFAAQVAMRPRLESEKKALEEKVIFPIDLPGEELTTRTLSLAMDIGMYLGQVFMKNHAQLKWDQPFGNKKFIDYGQPVLVAFKPGPFNPVRMAVTFAYGLAGHQKTGEGLRNIYETWSKLVI